MPRGLRVVPECGVFHIAIRGNNRRCVFRRDGDYIRFESLLDRYKRRLGFHLYHYVLMKNHVHLILKTKENADISKIMQGISLSYHHYYRRKNRYVGHLWQGRFKSFVIKDNHYLLAAALYVEKNPVEAGLVNDPSEYRWSSYRCYASGDSNPIVDASPIYEEMGRNAKERQLAYKELICSRIAESKNGVDRQPL